MDITPIIPKDKNFISSYQEGKFLINDREYHNPIIVFPDRVIELKVFNINEKEHFESFVTEEIEVLLVGAGKMRTPPNPSVKFYLLQQKSLSFEFMSTDAACRTYNILISEGRFVVAFLLPIYA